MSGVGTTNLCTLPSRFWPRTRGPGPAAAVDRHQRSSLFGLERRKGRRGKVCQSRRHAAINMRRKLSRPNLHEHTVLESVSILHNAELLLVLCLHRRVVIHLGKASAPCKTCARDMQVRRGATKKKLGARRFNVNQPHRKKRKEKKK